MCHTGSGGQEVALAGAAGHEPGQKQHGSSRLQGFFIAAQVAAQLKEGHNVVLLANHQTEADPGVFAHMLMATHPQLATDVIYVAGKP